MKYRDRLKAVADYQAQLKSNKTYVYEVFNTKYPSQSFTVVLADTDAEAAHIAMLVNPNALWMRRDHWGKGPKIVLNQK